MSISFKIGSAIGAGAKLTVKGFLGIGTVVSVAAGKTVEASHHFVDGVGAGFSTGSTVNRRKPKVVAEQVKPAAAKKAAAPVRRTRTKSVASA